MNDFQTPENSSIVPQKSGELISLDNFKSIFYQLNAKPDTEIRLLRGKKNLELADITSLNERISAKLSNHDVITEIASINFVLLNRKIKDYYTWAEFERENWDTVNEKVSTLSIKWDIAIKLPQYKLPQRHSIKVRIGTEIPPKDIFQLILTSDDISELIEARTQSICKVDFVNNILAVELLNLVSNWYEGLHDLPDANPVISFLRKNGRLISEIIRYSLPIVLLLVSYQYSDYWLPAIGIEEKISPKNLEALLIWLAAAFRAGIFLGFKLEKFINKRIDKFEDYPRFSITRGDKKAIEEFEKTNKKLKNQILIRVFWVLFALAVSSSVKLVGSYFVK
jgi:hypothetical protein